MNKYFNKKIVDWWIGVLVNWRHEQDIEDKNRIIGGMGIKTDQKIEHCLCMFTYCFYVPFLWTEISIIKLCLLVRKRWIREFQWKFGVVNLWIIQIWISIAQTTFNFGRRTMCQNDEFCSKNPWWFCLFVLFTSSSSTLRGLVKNLNGNEKIKIWIWM